MTTLTLSRLPLAGIVAAALAAFAAPGGTQPTATTGNDRSAPTWTELENAMYSGVDEAGGPFTLVSGRWKGTPNVSGGSSRPSVVLVRGFRLAGDVNGDGREEAVVLLGAATGGSGDISYLAIAGRGRAGLENVATARVGDRVQVRTGRIDGGRIVIDVVQAGASDARCCPGDLVTRTWELQGGSLTERPATTTGRLGLESLAGADWVLRAFGWDEPAPETPAVTLALDGSKVVGSAGCNRYFATVTAGDQPGALTVGQAGTTRMMCPEPQMATETRFLEQLASARQIAFVGGQLALQYTKADRSPGVMLFERRARP